MPFAELDDENKHIDIASSISWKNTYLPVLALNEIEVGVRVYSRVLSWISGKLTVTKRTFWWSEESASERNRATSMGDGAMLPSFRQFPSFAEPTGLQDESTFRDKWREKGLRGCKNLKAWFWKFLGHRTRVSELGQVKTYFGSTAFKKAPNSFPLHFYTWELPESHSKVTNKCGLYSPTSPDEKYSFLI